MNVVNSNDPPRTSAAANLPTLLLSNKEAVAFYRSCQADIDRLYQAPKDLAQILGDLRSQITQIGANSQLTPVGKTTQQDAARKTANALVDKVFAAVEATNDSLYPRLLSALEEPAPDDADASRALLVEMRLQAAWNRLRPRLEANGGDNLIQAVVSIANEIVEADNMDGYRAMLRELPDFLKAQNQPVDRFMAMYEDATDALLSDVQRAARIIMQQFLTGKTSMLHNFNNARLETANKSTGAVAIVGFYPGENYWPNDMTTDAQRGLPTSPYSVLKDGTSTSYPANYTSPGRRNDA